MGLDLLTNATVIEEAIRFVYAGQKDKPKSASAATNEWVIRN